MALGISTTKHAFKPDELVVAVDGFWSGPLLVQKGQQLRGDHPAVRKTPELFVRAGDPEALAAARAQRFEDTTREASRANEEERERQSRPQWHDIPAEHRLLVVKAFDLGFFGNTIETRCPVGTVVDRRVEKIAKVVEEHPDWFAVRLTDFRELEAAKLEAAKQK